MTSKFTSHSNRAFSFVELLSVLGLIALLSGIGLVSVSIATRSAQKTKLETDVKTLNSALNIYQANGGSIAGLTTTDQILLKLKSTRSASDQKMHTGGPSGRMIDPRIVAVQVESGGWKKRAVFNSAKGKFEIAASNDSAGFYFDLDEDLNEASIPVESRDHGIVNYAENESWVWDHGTLVVPQAPRGPSSIRTETAPPNSDPGKGDGGKGPGDGDDGSGDGGGDGGGDNDDDGGGDPVDPPLPRLAYPNISHSSGGHPDTDFPLNVSITNVPDPSIANAVFRLGSGAWEPYSGPVSVPMNSALRVQFLAADPETHQDSYERYAFFYPIASSLSGSVKGDFHSAEGGGNLVSEVSQGGKFFSHGDPTIDLNGEIIDAGEPNTLKFEKAQISEAEPGVSFKLGDLYYHNGTTFNDSHATGVTLEVEIQLTSPAQTLSFDLDMDLVNTDNTDDDDASADYVKLTNLTQNIPLTINGVGYQIQLEFGGTDSFGFSTSNQFHVYEGATGQGELRATFIATP